jgi:hypothetical protein
LYFSVSAVEPERVDGEVCGDEEDDDEERYGG